MVGRGELTDAARASIVLTCPPTRSWGSGGRRSVTAGRCGPTSRAYGNGCGNWRPSAPASATGGSTSCCGGKGPSSITNGLSGSTGTKGWPFPAGPQAGGAGRAGPAAPADPAEPAVGGRLRQRRLGLGEEEPPLRRGGCLHPRGAGDPGRHLAARERVLRVLGRVAAARGPTREIALGNSPELAGRAVDRWVYEHGVRLRFIEAGKPVQNAAAESCNGRLRDKCLNEHWFLSLVDARRIVEDWREDYNRARPHSALGYRPPEEFRLAFDAAAIKRREWVGLSQSLDQTTGAGQIPILTPPRGLVQDSGSRSQPSRTRGQPSGPTPRKPSPARLATP